MIRKFLSEKRSTIAVSFAMMVVPITIVVGGAIDYSRSVHYRAQLQGVADAAALAAASQWTGADSAAATAIAGAYVTAGLANLPAGGAVSQSVVPSSPFNGNQIDITLTSSMPTSFLGLIQSSVPVTVYSTALNPTPYGNACAGVMTGAVCPNTNAFSASAADTNTVYWYYVPADGSIPPDSALNKLWSNASGTVNPAKQTFAITNGQQIAFAFRNKTGNYGTVCTANCGTRYPTYSQQTNQYGSTLNHTQTFYTHLPNPTASASGYNSTNNPTNINGVNGSTGNNCALRITINNATTGASVAPPSGSCASANDANYLAYAAPQCTTWKKTIVTFYWNDMGGNPDDKDYNDGVYSFSCGGNGASPTGSGGTQPRGIVLTN